MPRKKSQPQPVDAATDALPHPGRPEYQAVMKAMRAMTNDEAFSIMAQMQKSMPDAGDGSRLKSAFIDPFNLLDYMGSRAKPSRVTWQILRRMATSCKPVAAIIQTRQNQVAAFTQVPRRTGDIGFRITTRNPYKRPGEGDLDRMNELTNWFLGTGYDQFGEHFLDGSRKRDSLDSFIRKMVRDTLSLDAVCFEVQRNQRGQPHALWAVDPGTIKHAAEKYRYEEGRPIPVEPERTGGLPVRYVQELLNGVRIAEFNEKELVYGVRNPRTDVEIGGYGLGELEILMETVTQILFAERYNATYFTQNSLPQGVLNIAGKYSPEALEAFKRQWIAQVSGVANAWRIPIMAIDDSQGGAQFVPFKGNNKEMQFNLWLEYLIMTACSVYTIDPQEIGYIIKGAGGGPMVEHSGAVRIDFSKDKGLRPLLKFFARIFNEHVVQEIYPDLWFEWVGIDQMSEKDKIELTSKKITAGIITVNEARALDDLETVRANWANAPGNATLMQVYMGDMNYQRGQEAARQQQEAAMMSGPGSQPGAAPPEGGAPPDLGAGGPAGAPGLPAPGQPPSEVPQDQRTARPEDQGIEMPIPTRSQKDKGTGEFQQAREDEKKNGARKREFDTHGVNATKSQGAAGDRDDVVEIVV